MNQVIISMKKNLLLPFVFATVCSLANSQTYNFTNASAAGQLGPTQAQVTTAYSTTTLAGIVNITTQGIQEWVVPATGTYLITGVGACGGELQGTVFPGLPGTGATMQGEFILTSGTTIYVVVGQKGTYGDNGSGGGGGSFVYTGSPGGAGLMIAAGGGGGHGHGTSGIPAGANGGGAGITTAQVNGVGGTGNGGSPGAGLGGNSGGGGCSYGGVGAGGMGWTSNGGTPVGCGSATGGLYVTFVGGNGGSDGLFGGFGGGGGSDGNGSPGGGGGGFTGGGGGSDWNGSAWGAGAGAGSLNNGTLQVNTPGVTGAAAGFTHGSVTITYTCSPATITPDLATLADSIADCSITVSAPTATNNCGAPVIGVPDVTFPVTTFGTTVVTWTYDDGFNITTQTQNVIVTDVTGPVEDVTTLNDVYGCLSVTPSPPTATDNCSGPVTGTPDVTFPVTAQGTTVVTWSYDDGNGNISTQTQNVTVIVVDLNVSQSGATLTATSTIGTYQWLNCDNGFAIISGETNASYTPSTIVGNYAVEVSENGCVDTSACFLIDVTGINDLGMFGLSLFPNPNQGVFSIESANNNLNSIVIMDNSGRLVYEDRVVQGSMTKLDLTHFEKGVYFVKLSGGFGTVVEEVVIY